MDYKEQLKNQLWLNKKAEMVEQVVSIKTHQQISK